MMSENVLLLILWGSGALSGYVVGFFIARGIYRRPTWPH
jgi:hypothetical protein